MVKLKEYQKNLVIKASNIKNAGLGLFAKVDIPRGAKLGWYRGTLMTSKEWERMDNDAYAWLLFDEFDREYYVDGRKKKRNNKLRYMNGAFTPGQFIKRNVIAYQCDDKIWYKTCRRVRKGEELIIYYGKDYDLI